MGRALTSIEPATGETLWTGETGDVAHEVALASAAWPDWAARSLSVRIETMRRFANAVRSRMEDFAELIARETGKPLWEARIEIQGVITTVDRAATAYSERTPRKQHEGALGARHSVRHKPYGVMGIVTPWISPAEIACAHILPALIAGNTIVFKPSEKVPASSMMLLACFLEAEVPEGVLRLLTGDAREAAALAAHPDVAGILFTGSCEAGLALNRQLADHPGKLMTLQMGGNNPMLVWDAPDVATAAVMVVQSAFLSGGQRCTAARRLIVAEQDHEALLGEIGNLAARLIVADPLGTPQPFMGPMIDNPAADAVDEAFLDLIMKGGRPLHHMRRLDPDLPFLTPGLIDVTKVAQRPDTEHFGPMLQVIRVPDFDAAIAEANATRYGLTATLISRNPDLYDRFWANAHAGAINWNRPSNIVPPTAPFGGLGLSGNHRPGGAYTADHCAYPVTSSENEQMRANIGIGLRDV
jgi:succinylglutamic semialdehyde dehydrogenase